MHDVCKPYLRYIWVNFLDQSYVNQLKNVYKAVLWKPTHTMVNLGHTWFLFLAQHIFGFKEVRIVSHFCDHEMIKRKEKKKKAPVSIQYFILIAT